MANKTRKIFSSALTIVGAFAMAFGVTYALFSNRAETNIVVSSGKIRVSATLSDLSLYSANPNLEEGEIVEGGDQLGEYSGTYRYQLMDDTFINGGSGSLSNDGKLTLVKMTPGDKANAKLTVSNQGSNIKFKYRVIAEAFGDNLDMFGALKITALNESLTRVTKYATPWKLWDDSKTTEVSDVSVIFPLTSINSVQDSECGIKFSVEAIQANAITNDNISTETLPVQPAYHYALAETISSGDKYALTINANSKNYYIPSIPTTGNKAAFVEYTDVADIPVSETFTIRRLTDENTKGVLVNGNGEYLYHSGGTNTSVYIKHEETEKPDSYYAWTLPTVDTPRLVNSSNLTLFLHVTALDMYFVAKDFASLVSGKDFCEFVFYKVVEGNA